MNVVVALVGVDDHQRQVFWPPDWPVPVEGDTVELPGLPPLAVRTVVWYPEGSDEDDEDVREPFVYLVIGPRRPS